MVKKPQQPKKPLDFSMLKGIGRGLKDILVASATHPTIAGLAVMTSCVILKVASQAYKEETPTQKRLAGELTGLYNGAQSLAVASAVIPMALTGIQTLGSLGETALKNRAAPP